MSANPDEHDLVPCLQELCRKPNFQELIELAKDWARDIWYTEDSEVFFLRDMLTHAPRFDIPPCGPDEVCDLVKCRFTNLRERSTMWDSFVAPKADKVLGSDLTGKHMIEKLLWLRQKLPAGFEPKVPLEELEDGRTKFVWSWEAEGGKDSSGVKIDAFLDGRGIWVSE